MKLNSITVLIIAAVVFSGGLGWYVFLKPLQDFQAEINYYKNLKEEIAGKYKYGIYVIDATSNIERNEYSDYYSWEECRAKHIELLPLFVEVSATELRQIVENMLSSHGIAYIEYDSKAKVIWTSEYGPYWWWRGSQNIYYWTPA